VDVKVELGIGKKRKPAAGAADLVESEARGGDNDDVKLSDNQPRNLSQARKMIKDLKEELAVLQCKNRDLQWRLARACKRLRHYTNNDGEEEELRGDGEEEELRDDGDEEELRDDGEEEELSDGHVDDGGSEEPGVSDQDGEIHDAA
jgi:adenylate kinase family enzyme